MGGKSWESTFGGIKNGGEVSTGLRECGAFVFGELRVDVDIKVRVLYPTHGRFRVTFGPSNQILFCQATLQREIKREIRVRIVGL